MLARLGDTPRKLSVGRYFLQLHRELAYGEVRLLLTGAGFAERDAPDLRHRLMRAGVLRLASHLTQPSFLTSVKSTSPRRSRTYFPASIASLASEAKSTIVCDRAGIVSLRPFLPVQP